MEIENLKLNMRNILHVSKKIVLCSLIGAQILYTSAKAGEKDQVKRYVEANTVQTVINDYEDICDIEDELNESSISELNSLEKYLALSEILHSLDLDTNLLSSNDLTKLKEPNDIAMLIDIYNEGGEEKRKVKPTLTEQETIINFYLSKQGYSIVANAGLDVFKAVIADAKEEQLNTYYDKDMVIVPDKVRTPSRVDKVVEDIKLPVQSDPETLLDNIYKIQERERQVQGISNDDPNLLAYNQRRNQELREATSSIKVILMNDYTANKKGKIEKVS